MLGAVHLEWSAADECQSTMEGSKACVREGWRRRGCVGPVKRYDMVGVISIQATVTFYFETG
jgi:hypothetical protein